MRSSKRRGASIGPSRRGGFHLIVARRIGALVLAVAAVVVFFAMAPQSANENVRSDVSAALADDSLNQGRAEGAPQQAVVNGWAARDLLAIQARAIADQNPPDGRPAALLLIAVLGVMLGLATSGGSATNEHRQLIAPPPNDSRSVVGAAPSLGDSHGQQAENTSTLPPSNSVGEDDQRA